MTKIEIFEEEGDNTLWFDNKYADFTIQVYPESKTYSSRMSLKDDVYYRTEQYQYRIKIDPIKVETRLFERADDPPPDKYCVKDGVVLESDILSDILAERMTFLTKGFIVALKKEVEWHENWVGDPVSIYILSKHPDIISPDGYKRYLRQLSEKIKSATQKVEKVLESDKTGLQVIDGKCGRVVWYPEDKLKKIDKKELEKMSEHAFKFEEKLFDEKASEYVGITEVEFRSGEEILENIEVFQKVFFGIKFRASVIRCIGLFIVISGTLWLLSLIVTGVSFLVSDLEKNEFRNEFNLGIFGSSSVDV